MWKWDIASDSSQIVESHLLRIEYTERLGTAGKL